MVASFLAVLICKQKLFGGNYLWQNEKKYGLASRPSKAFLRQCRQLMLFPLVGLIYPATSRGHSRKSQPMLGALSAWPIGGRTDLLAVVPVRFIWRWPQLRCCLWP